jgi:hypothetical protein
MNKIKITVEVLDSVLKAAFDFYCGRNNQSIEAYCLDAIMCSLEGDEAMSQNYFETLRSELEEEKTSMSSQKSS